VLRSVHDLEKLRVLSADGRQCGRIRDCYFDDQTWEVKHLVISIEPRKFGRKHVVLGPKLVNWTADAPGVVRLQISSEALENAPMASSVLPVCRQYASFAFSSPSAAFFPRSLGSADPRLRSAKAVMNYRIDVAGESGGILGDILFDDQTWAIRYLRAEQLIERKKLQFHLLPQSVERFTWATERLILRELQPVALEMQTAAEIAPELAALPAAEDAA
jgi:sporulation protein YlmC with PRC-barrel domain